MLARSGASESLLAAYSTDDHCLLQPKKLNFDFSHELDEYMAPSELLTHQKRKNRDVNKLSKEMRQLEEE